MIKHFFLSIILCIIFTISLAQDKVLLKHDAQIVKLTGHLAEKSNEILDYIRQAQNAGTLEDTRLFIDLALLEGENFSATVQYLINELLDIHNYADKNKWIDMESAAGKVEDKYYDMKLMADDIIYALQDASRFSALTDMHMKLSLARSKMEDAMNASNEAELLLIDFRKTAGLNQ